jgi:hypothetical protein
VRYHTKFMRSGFPKWALDDLRRLALSTGAFPLQLLSPHATYLVAADIDARTVADRLGHVSPSFALATYAHAVGQAQERAAATVSTLLVLSGASVR